MKLVMTLLLKNEQDIVRSNIEFHLAHGVDHVLAVDNGSTDGTRDVLADYERMGIATIVDEPGDDFAQSKWVTAAALKARDELGADWILNNDADEFWWPPSGNLKDGLQATEANKLLCKRRNMLCTSEAIDTAPWPDCLIHRMVQPVDFRPPADIYGGSLGVPFLYLNLPPKALVRGEGLVKVAQGNHNAVHTTSDTSAQSDVWIYHFPVRSRIQLERKVVEGGSAYMRNTDLPETVGWHWRRWYRMLTERGLDAVLEDVLPSAAQFDADVASGRVVQDTNVRSHFGGFSHKDEG